MSASEIFEYWTWPVDQGVDLVVEAHVLTVVVAEHRGEQQGVVQGGVEGPLREPGCPLDCHPVQQAVPLRGGRCERPTRNSSPGPRRSDWPPLRRQRRRKCPL